MMHALNKFVVGLDFGTDHVRAVLLRIEDGEEVGRSVQPYERWGRQQYCDAARQQFRQHPRDLAEAMTRAVRGLAKTPGVDLRQVVAIGVDTTGSSPLPVGKDARPLGFYDELKDDPDALCLIWKDHTAVAEAEEINALCHSGRIRDYTRYVGGVYSTEWFWAKILHVTRKNPKVRAAAATWVEMCDWVPALLAGITDPARIVRSRCAAGHKALWSSDWGGMPGREFVAGLDERLLSMPCPFFASAVPSDHAAGRLCAEWAERLGLPEGIVIAVGAFDCHMGAVGGGVTPYTFTRVMGTPTCDILIAPPEEVGETVVCGICGQVPGSVLPDFIGFEAGQSSFGDTFAWFADLLSWGSPTPERRQGILAQLAEAAEKLPPGCHGEAALDWFNGRRTPDADQRVTSVIAGLHLGSSAPAVYRAIVEATAFGALAIVNRFEEHGIPVKRVIALGGIPNQPPLVMQVSADVLNRPIGVVASEECCARGAGIFAAAAAGEYRSAWEAQQAMAAPIRTEYTPNSNTAAVYRDLYGTYQVLGAFAQSRAHGNSTDAAA